MKFGKFLIEKVLESLMGDFVLRVGKHEADGFSAERTKGAFEFALFVPVATAFVDGFVLEHDGAVIKQGVMPFLCLAEALAKAERVNRFLCDF